MYDHFKARLEQSVFRTRRRTEEPEGKCRKHSYTHMSGCVTEAEHTLMEAAGVLIREIKFRGSNTARFLQTLWTTTITVICFYIGQLLLFGLTTIMAPWGKLKTLKSLLKGRDIPQFDKGSSYLAEVWEHSEIDDCFRKIRCSEIENRILEKSCKATTNMCCEFVTP